MNTTSCADFCRAAIQMGIVLLIQSTVILLIGLGSDRLLQRRSPLAQSFACRAALIAVTGTVLLTLFLSPYLRSFWRISLPAPTSSVLEIASYPPPIASEPAAISVPALETRHPISTPNMASVPVDTDASTFPGLPHSQTLSLAERLYLMPAVIWGLGTLCLLVWLVIGQFCLIALRRRALPVTIGLAADTLRGLCAAHGCRPLPLLMSPQVHSPFLGGLRCPAIFLPASFEEEFDATMLRAVFAHEIAHRERRDNAWVLAARLICALLWMQPLLWLCLRRMEQTSEEICDLRALQDGCSAREYANCLLTLAERLIPTRLERSLGAGIIPFRSQIGKRIQQILSRRNFAGTISIRFRVLAIAGSALTILLGSWLISSADAPNSAADLVQAYLQARSQDRLAAAYGYLSPQTQHYVSLSQFEQHLHIIGRPHIGDPHAAWVQQTATVDFFTDGFGNFGYRYKLIGPAPDDPSVSLVRAYPPGVSEQDALTLRILTTPDPNTKGGLKLDLIATAKPLIPNIVEKLQARNNQLICSRHLLQISLAMEQYIQKHHEHFPHADHWVDEIMPYVKDPSIFHDPAGLAGQKYSYAFNRNLSGLSLERVDSPTETVAVFDSSKGVKNASDIGQSLPRPGRHDRWNNFAGNDIAFADCHVKYYRDSEQHQLSFDPSSSSHGGASPTKKASIQATEGNSRQGLRTRQRQTDTEARLAIVAQDNVPIHSKATKDSRILSIVPRGQSLAINGQTENYYQVLMIDHSFGYIAQDAVQLLNYEVMHTPAPTLGQQMVRLADSYLGTPYIRHGHTHTGIDDSGLVKAIYASAKIPLPQSDFAQSGVGYDVPHNVATGDWKQWVPGDRLYFAFRHPRIDHTGMYIGKGLFIHASVGHGSQVAIDHVNSPYYAKHLVAVRRSQELLGEPTL